MNRRRFLTGAAVGGTLGASGCLSGIDPRSDPPDPVDLSGGKFDDHHGMEIGPHGGANGQIFYEEYTPQSRERGPFWFHTLAFSLFPFHFEQRSQEREPTIVYVTDFSAVEYTVETRDGAPRMPSPTAPDSFADATGLTFVVESGVMGGMGPDLHPFSDPDDADAFVSKYGGRTIGFEDITPELIEALTSSSA
jgi:nitrous oxide reductase accessory protein NosL